MLVSKKADPVHMHCKKQMIICNLKTFASPSKNNNEKEKKENKKAIAKVSELHANAIIIIPSRQ